MLKILILIIVSLPVLSGCGGSVITNQQETNPIKTDLPEPSSKPLVVDACDLSGKREPNVKVNIGYSDNDIKREYYAYTNEYSQVVRVSAKELILQTKDEENNDGRYCKDEAKVNGTELSDYDEGHILADSLGGVSNAYNITPQKSIVNRKRGQQYKWEEEMRSILSNHGTITDVEVIIEYPDTKTMTPNKYKFSWVQNGSKRNLEFDNK